MKRNKNGIVTISEDEFTELTAKIVARDELIQDLDEAYAPVVFLLGRFVAQTAVEMFGESNTKDMIDRHEAKAKEKSEKIRDNVVKKIDEFLRGFFEDPIQVFNTRNKVGDEMTTIYSDDDVIIDYCSGREYIEVFGLSDKEFEYLVNNSHNVYV